MKHATMALIAAVLLFIGVLRIQGWYAERQSAWKAEAREALGDAVAAQARADSALHAADSLASVADSASRKADRLAAANRRLSARADSIRAHIDTVEVPADALPYTAPRDSLIAILSEQVDTLESALASERNASTLLRESNASLKSSITELSATVDRMRKVIESAPVDRWWVPVITIGGAAGVDVGTRKVFAGPAVSAGWKLKL